jgi:hypothetical protein
MAYRLLRPGRGASSPISYHFASGPTRGTHRGIPNAPLKNKTPPSPQGRHRGLKPTQDEVNQRCGNLYRCAQSPFRGLEAAPRG